MQPVTDASGRRFLLQKRSDESWLLLDPETGASVYRDASECTVLEDESPLEAAASGVPDPVRRLVLAARSERALGLAVAVVDRGPVAVRTLLAETTLCESDLHGQVAEFVAAGLLEEADVAGERGYRATAAGRRAVAQLRGEPAAED